MIPVGKDVNNRQTFSGTEFETLDEAQAFNKNAGFKGASLISNGTLYGTTDRDFAQAKADIA